MDFLSVYIVLFAVIFLVFPATYFGFRFVLWLILDYCGCHISCDRSRAPQDQSPIDDDESFQQSYRLEQARSRDRSRRRHDLSNWGLFYDRQGNIFTISDEGAAQRDANRYPDFFYLEPSTEEARRIRAQLEKDDKDLPTYEEVMRITALEAAGATPSDNTPQGTAAATTAAVSEANITAQGNAASSSGTNSVLTDSTPAPPYSEVISNETTETNSQVPSTSRAAAVTLQIVTETSPNSNA